MPWTEITRKQYRRDALRYASDITDAEWALVKRLLPRANRRGRPRKTICGALWRRFFIFFRRAVSGGRCCRSSRPTLQCRGTFIDGGIRAGRKGSSTFWSGGHARRLGRTPNPTAAVIDGQSAPTTQAGDRAATTQASASTAASGIL